jgi:hypothetical protein
MNCLLNPGQCFAQGFDWLFSFVPFGFTGAVFIAGVIVGAVLKWKGIAIVVSLWALLRLLPAKAVPTEQLFPHPDDKPAPKKRKTLF